MTLILKFDLTFALTDIKINLGKEKNIQNKYHSLYISRQKGSIMNLYRNSTLRYFGRNATSISFNSNCYNLASMLQCNV